MNDPRLGTGAPDDEPDLARVLAQVVDTVDYLRVATSAPPHEGWLSCADLVTRPAVLGALVRSTARGTGTHVHTVAASLFVQGYAFRIGALVLAPFALGLPTPSCDPLDTFIRMNGDQPATVAVTDRAVVHRDVERIAAELLGGHLAPLVAATTQEITVGRRLLWGNIASAIATVFRAVEGTAGIDRSAVRARADAFLAAAEPWLSGLGRFEMVDGAARTGWYWTRSNCCLWYQSSNGRRCTDCSLHTPSELAAIRRAELAMT
jgi:ferric iron reductase protein FhuF